MSSLNIKDITDLSKYKHCKSIDLSCNKIESVWHETFQPCPFLKEVKLYSNKLKKIEGIENLNHLESLQVQYNQISKIGNSLDGCRNLKLLRLDSNKLSVLKKEEVFLLQQLTYLDISSNNLHDIEAVCCLMSLKEFHCSSNQIEKIPDMSSLKKLQEINLSDNSLANLSGLKGLMSLNILCIKNNNISSLTHMKSSKTLTELDVSFNKIKTLSHVQNQFPNLEVLSASSNYIENIEEVKSLENLTALKELEIKDNPITLNVESHTKLKSALDSLHLVCLDGRNIQNQDFNNRPKSAMRPMSANQMVSERLISDQLLYDEMCLSDFEDRIMSQFSSVRGLLDELPKSRPKSGIFNKILVDL